MAKLWVEVRVTELKEVEVPNEIVTEFKDATEKLSEAMSRHDFSWNSEAGRSYNAIYDRLEKALNLPAIRNNYPNEERLTFGEVTTEDDEVLLDFGDWQNLGRIVKSYHYPGRKISEKPIDKITEVCYY